MKDILKDLTFRQRALMCFWGVTVDTNILIYWKLEWLKDLLGKKQENLKKENDCL